MATAIMQRAIASSPITVDDSHPADLAKGCKVRTSKGEYITACYVSKHRATGRCPVGLPTLNGQASIRY